MQSRFGHDDQEDGRLDREATEQLNFGGGLLTKKAGTAETDEDPERRRTEKEACSSTPSCLGALCDPSQTEISVRLC